MSTQVLLLAACLAAIIVYYWKQLVMLFLVGVVTVLLVGVHELLAHLAVTFRP